MYVLVFGIGVYVLAVRASSNRNFSPVKAAFLVVLLPFIFAKILWYIYLTGYRLPLTQLISVSDVVITIIQLVYAYFVFRRIEQAEDSIESWFIWGGLGLVGIYFAIPYFIRLVIPA